MKLCHCEAAFQGLPPPKADPPLAEKQSQDLDCFGSAKIMADPRNDKWVL